MLFTVPGLRDEGDDAFVEPDVPMMDDGCEGRFVRAYIWDDIPWMDMRHEVRDLMTLAVPSLAMCEDVSFADTEIPDDGMEATWFDAEPEAYAEVPAAEPVAEPAALAIAPAAEAPMVAAPAATAMLAMPAEAPVAEEAPGCALDAILAAEEILSAEQEPVQEAAAETAMEDIPEDVSVAALAMTPGEYFGTVAEDIPVAEPAPLPAEEPACVQSVDVDAVIEDLSSEALVAAVGEAVVLDGIILDEMTVISPETDDTLQVELAEPAAVTEDGPAVRFSFGSQEVRGSGWRVCFSF